jgi:hypothetical protein
VLVLLLVPPPLVPGSLLSRPGGRLALPLALSPPLPAPPRRASLLQVALPGAVPPTLTLALLLLLPWLVVCPCPLTMPRTPRAS